MPSNIEVGADINDNNDSFSNNDDVHLSYNSNDNVGNHSAANTAASTLASYISTATTSPYPVTLPLPLPVF